MCSVVLCGVLLCVFVAMCCDALQCVVMKFGMTCCDVTSCIVLCCAV